MTPDPAAVSALARALHHDVCLRYDPEPLFCGRDHAGEARAILATDWTPAERAALAAAITWGGGTDNCRICDLTYPKGTDHKCTDGWKPAPAPDLLAAKDSGYVMALRDHDECCGTLRNHRAALAAAIAPGVTVGLDVERALTLTRDLYADLGEVLAYTVQENAEGRYICHICESDVTSGPHSDDCEAERLRKWTYTAIPALRAALPEEAEG